jgi:hypothetical protein
MKKYIFIVLFALIFVTGCGSQKNTVKFNPIGTTEETGESVDKNAETDSAVKTDPNPGLIITSFAGDKLETKIGYHVIRGIAPKNTNTIKINDYTLTKYHPGETEWSYVASSALGTLKEGDNRYTVTALDKEGAEIGSKSFTITYQAPENLPSTGGSGGLAAFIISLLISTGYFATKRLWGTYIKNI